jgi:hypothetical protein
VARYQWIFLLLAAVVVGWYALTRDIRYSRQYMGDLRNRVVGARIIEDGGSPYFYKYSPGDTIRYYDPQAFDIYFPSICTSTPFLHRLLVPVAGLSFAVIMRVWVVVLWVLFLGMAGYALAIARGSSARMAVMAVVLLFLLTNGWDLQVKYGQSYLVIAALAMLVVALWRWPVLAGVAAAALVLVRPNAVLFFLPFVLAREIKWVFLLPGVLALGWVLLSPRERSLWGDYERMLSVQVRIHQGLGVPTRPMVADPAFANWEGVNRDTVKARIARDPVRIYSENGNVFVLYAKVIGRRMPLWLLGVAGFLAVAGVTAIFVRRRVAGTATDGRTGAEMRVPNGTVQTAIVGFCLYMLSDLCSPVYRHQYYTVQWLMPLLLAASIYRGRMKGWYFGLLVAVALNIVHVPGLRMSNTLGEYGFLVCLLAIALDPGRPERQKVAPAGLP